MPSATGQVKDRIAHHGRGDPLMSKLGAVGPKGRVDLRGVHVDESGRHNVSGSIDYQFCLCTRQRPDIDDPALRNHDIRFVAWRTRAIDHGRIFDDYVQDQTSKLMSGNTPQPAMPAEGKIVRYDTLLYNNPAHSTVTDFARLRGWSTSQPRRTAM